MRSAARLILPAIGRIPDAVDRRMQPELQQNVIGFERGVGRQQRAPVAVRMLQREKVFGGAARVFCWRRQ